MQVEIFTLCEYATVSEQRMTVLNTFENYAILGETGAFNGMCAIKLRATHDDLDGTAQVLTVLFLDPDGKTLTTFNLPFVVKREDSRSPVYFWVLTVSAARVSSGPHSLRMMLQPESLLFDFPVHVQTFGEAVV